MGAVLVDCALYQDGRRLPLPAEIGSLEQLVDRPQAFAWVGLKFPQTGELARIVDSLGISDQVDIDKILAPHYRPAISEGGEVLEVVMRTAKYVDSREVIQLGEMTLLVTSRAIVSLRFGDASPLTGLRSTLERAPSRLGAGPLGVLAEILLQVITDYGPALDGFEHDLVEAEEQVFANILSQPVRRLFHLKREVRQFQGPLQALEDLLVRLTRHAEQTCRSSGVPTTVLDDLNVAKTMLARTAGRTRSLSNLLDTAMSASLAQTAMKQNEDMRKMSAWVAIGGANTLVAGIYGMNFEHMPELEWGGGYAFALALMAVVSLLLWRNFRRAGWL